MSKELIVSTGKHETRVAILEDDQLVEIFHERRKEYLPPPAVFTRGRPRGVSCRCGRNPHLWT